MIGAAWLIAWLVNLLISSEYAAMNREMHAQKRFGAYGARWAPFIHDFAMKCEARSLLDYGCGQGTLRSALSDLRGLEYGILEYDPAIPDKQDKPQHADVVVCSDVMEHVEPECLYAVLDDIRNIARIGVFFVISTSPAKKHLPDGRNAHLIVEPAEWWINKLLQRWRPLAFSDVGPAFAFMGAAK